jgi:hypothetical protein
MVVVEKTNEEESFAQLSLASREQGRLNRALKPAST